MKKIKLLLVIVAIGLSFFTSCKTEDTIEGSDYSESALVVGWSSSTITESYFTDIGTLNNTYPVNILGGGDGSPTTKDITIKLTVDASTTATDGAEYSLPGNSFTIPAGSTFASIAVNVNTGGFNSTQPTKLVLNIETSENGVVVSSLAEQFTINFVGCKSLIGNSSYAVTTVREDGATVSRGVEVIITESVNSFWTKSVGLWTTNNFLNGSQPSGRGIKFEDICGTLTIPKHDLGNHYTNEVGGTGTATVKGNGDFVLKYYIMFSGVPTKYTSTYIKQ